MIPRPSVRVLYCSASTNLEITEGPRCQSRLHRKNECFIMLLFPRHYSTIGWSPANIDAGKGEYSAVDELSVKLVLCLCCRFLTKTVITDSNYVIHVVSRQLYEHLHHSLKEQRESACRLLHIQFLCMMVGESLTPIVSSITKSVQRFHDL
jgi:hypothetical protein